MRLVRFRHGDRIATGVREGPTIRALRGTFFEEPIPTGEEVPADDVRLLAPVIPSKIVAVARNNPGHAAELGNPVPESPILFFKPATSVIGPGDPIPLPPGAGRVDHEAELAVVMGRLCRRVDEADALRYVLGYTCANDVTAREWQKQDGQWARAKGSDGFCPLGPWIDTELDPADVGVEARVNGETRQSGRTSDFLFSAAALVAFISRTITLLPGDVVLTGTPAGVGPLKAGDTVEVEVEGVGVLENGVVEGG
ncbi:MAG TPA: fumarylacetoacetate hydrolase family protein [Actinomycetota bacterium]|nr:fumarylacetoacetate hydrolase family protein [Actinomycetota bacterium]